MARRKKTKRKTKKKIQKQTSERVVGGCFILFGILGLLNLGYLGILLANVFRIFVGDSYKVAVVLLIGYGTYLLSMGEQPIIPRKKIGGVLLAYLGVLLFLEVLLFQKLDLHANFVDITWQYLSSDIISGSVGSAVGGGITGALLYSATSFLVAQIGSYIVAVLIFIAGLCLLFDIAYRQVFEYLGKTLYWIISETKKVIVAFSHSISKGNDKVKQIKKARQEKAIEKAKENEITHSDDEERDLPTPVADMEKSEVDNDSKDNLTDWNQPVEDKSEDEQEIVVKNHPTLENYQLPSVNLLQDVPPTDQSEEKAEIQRNKKILKETFKSFGVDVELKNTILGPSVTKYELHPAIGVKVSKIVNLADDLALALAAKDIRIEAPIPGKSLIGIEVPNKKVATISFKDIISSQKKDSSKPLEVPIGRDVSGSLITADLAKMPHLLIAGSTGSGKSVAINGIITSLLMNCPPDEVKLMLVDPKKVELGVYNGIPHLLTPVVTDPKKASRALHKLVLEMERRYELFANTGQRNISGYNAMIQRQNHDNNSKEPLMPYIVAIVDELSDLMMVASNEAEDVIIRLAQMARAAGIHMILATQRPSVDVITGLIKANVPSRMAFAVSSGTDSRTIIDQSGAEKLLGRGDMLFLPMGMNKPVRVQGAFISDSDVENVVNFVREQLPAEYDESMEVSDEELQHEADGEAEDELFSEAVEFVRQEQKCSVSMLQRRFRIGYNRSARIVDEMEKRGIVGPQEGSKPRKVYSQDN